MKQSVKNIALLAFASVIAALFASCGTVRGFGRDVGTVGEGIQKSTR
jgi:predicted small secreted protein